MLVTAVISSLVATACTSTSDSTTSTTAVTTTSTNPPTTTTEPLISTGIGVEEDTIRLGVMVPRSGPVATFGDALLTGQNAYWTYVNEVLGGVGGVFTVELTVFDHRFDPDEAEAGYDLLRGEVLGISGSIGTLIDERIAPLAASDGVLAMAGSLSSQWVGHEAILPNLLLPTYRDQVAAGLDWAVGSGLAARTGILFQEGAYGEDCLKGYDRAISEGFGENVARVGHPPAATDFGNVVGQLFASDADSVVVCTTPDALVRIIATADSLGFQPNWLVSAQSFDAGVPTALGGDAGLEAGLAALDRTWVLGASPPANSPARLLIDDVFSGVEGADWYSLLGYAQAATFHLILEEALESFDLTRSGLQAAVGRLENLDLGLGGALSSLVAAVPVGWSAAGIVTAESLTDPFGIPVSEPYFASPFGNE
jgi:ABC-type branched-subunit amino acid transport system substrate-binding protein